MALVSVSQAATLVGRDRKTLYRDIATGRISAKKDGKGRVQIDTSELLRVFGAFSGATSGESPTPQAETRQETAELSQLRTENAALRAQLDAQAANLADLRQAMKLLEYREAPKRSWWPFGKK